MGDDGPGRRRGAAVKDHTVVQGDSMASIAKAYGFLWEQLWEHPRNAELKARRKNPNVLVAGDVVFIPALVNKTLAVETERRHRYRRKGIPSKISLQLMEGARPRAGLPFTISLDDGSVIEGETDADGFVKASVQPERKSAVVQVKGRWGPERYQVQLGHLDPIDETTGVQQRLKNLGRPCAVTGERDEQTEKALRRFQKEQSLPITGEPDEPTKARLLELCGS